MVAYLEKSEGSEGFHQIIDFLLASHIKNALTVCPNLYASHIQQFWQTATLSTTEDGVRGITTTIDRKVKVFVSEASIRRHLKLDDSEGLRTLPSAESFEQLALMGYGFQGIFWVYIPLFLTMLTTPESSPSKITSSPSLSPQTHSSTSQPPSTPPSNQTTPVTEEAAPLPHESPLQSVHLLRRNKGSLSLNEFKDLWTSLSKKVESLESDLKQTKQTYNATLTKLIKMVKKLEETIKTSQARRRAKVIARRRQSVENIQTYTKRRREVSTSSGGVSTASRLVSTADINTASELDSTAGVKEKDKGNGYSLKDKNKTDKTKHGIGKSVKSHSQRHEEIISTKIDLHHFNAEYDLIESLLNRDTLIISSPKIDYLLEDFFGELAHIDLIPPGINKADFDLEEDIHLVEKLLYDNSSPRPPEELNFENFDVVIESFSPYPILVEGSDSLMEELDLFLTPDDLMPPGIENDDYDSEGDILFLLRIAQQ
ncbi:hypothetical protein Tco_1030483 [Tanacetum coccineum]|uniref:Reverse transcriptase domain-containing protein n=1 Tax=Tanacetum coccineum TaxID=301880 RepID=A0ABQ5G8L5_9ASTR